MVKKICGAMAIVLAVGGLAYGGKTEFSEGTPALGIKGTKVTAAFLNSVNKHYCTGLDVDGDCSLAYSSATGTNDLTLALNPAITQYVTGMPIYLKAAATNTGAMTLNVNGLGAKAIKKGVNQALIAGDVQTGLLITVFYDGTYFQFTQAVPALTPIYDHTITGSAVTTMSTGTILNGALHGGYHIEAVFYNSSGVNTNISVLFNNDNTNENYTTGYAWATSETTTATNQLITAMPTNTSYVLDGNILYNGISSPGRTSAKFDVLQTFPLTAGGPAVTSWSYHMHWQDWSGGQLQNITLLSSTANGFGIGSRLRVWRKM